MKACWSLFDFNIKNKLSDSKLRDLLAHFSKYRLRNEDFERPDLLGTAYGPHINQYFETAEIEFVLVGAGHLVGEVGLLELLEKEGYLVEQF